MKYYIFPVISFFVFVLVAQAVVQTNARSAHIITPQSYIAVQNSPTTTASIPQRGTILLDTEYAAQGGCVAIKDSDGLGYTYLQTLNGVPTFSQFSCE